MKPLAVTGVGGWPGTNVRDAAMTVRDECELLPHLPELPERGPGADMIGRTMTRVSSVASDFAVATVPGGWRLTGGRGRDMSRGDGYWNADLDAVEEVFDGFTGDFKVQMVGPWTLAASVEDRAGERVLRDAGAVRELGAALRETWSLLLAEFARRIPGAAILLQVDEPLLADVLNGAVKTQSSWGSYEPVEAVVVTGLLRSVREVHAGPCALHCCAAEYPFDVVRDAGFDGLSFDMAAVGGRAVDAVGQQIDAGGFAMLGIEPASVAAGEAAVTRLGAEIGYSGAQWASHIALTPPCDLLDMPLSAARARMERLRQVAAAVVDGD